MKIYFVRHSETSLNKSGDPKGVLKGWMNNPIDKKGIQEAQANAKKLGGKNISAVYGSDLQRARETAKIIGKSLSVPVKTSGAFRSQNWGNLTGQQKTDMVPVIKGHVAEPNKPIPGGESFNNYKTRFLGGLKNIVNKGQNVALVGHNWSDNLISEWLKNGQNNNFKADPNKIMNGGVAPGGIKEFNINASS